MGSADEVQVVAVQELADHISSEREGDAAVVFPPALDVLIGVRPQQITQEAWQEEKRGYKLQKKIEEVLTAAFRQDNWTWSPQNQQEQCALLFQTALGTFYVRFTLCQVLKHQGCPCIYTHTHSSPPL